MRVAGLLLALIWAVPAIAQDDPVLYRYRDKTLLNGAFGPIATFQQALFAKAKACGVPGADTVTADGAFGPKTRAAIVDLVRCYPYGPSLPAGSAAFQGAITEALWRLVVEGQAPPVAEQRAKDLTLAFEGTDFLKVEFNFCQSRSPTTGRLWVDGDPQCYSNDPCSFATWGPRGATAGNGREIQAILYEVRQSAPDAIAKAFAAEAAHADRLLKADRRSTQRLLCAVFAAPERRQAWKTAFDRLGRDPGTRDAYERVYRSVSADGGKIRNFLRLYAELKPLIGRDPTEVDFAFFLDRATHGGVPKDIPALHAYLAKLIKGLTKPPSPAELRWAVAARLPVSNLQRDRTARDVVFLYDGMGDRVGADALAAWRARGPIRASDYGLSDSRPAPEFTAGPALAYIQQPTQDVAIDADVSGCPSIVFQPVHPDTGKQATCKAD